MVRVDGVRTLKASAMVYPSNVLTIIHAGQIKILRFLLPGNKRGPAVEARLLYEDISSSKIYKNSKKTNVETNAIRTPGSGRPTKKQRRQTNRLKNF